MVKKLNQIYYPKIVRVRHEVLKQLKTETYPREGRRGRAPLPEATQNGQKIKLFEQLNLSIFGGAAEGASQLHPQFTRFNNQFRYWNIAFTWHFNS